MLAQSGIVPMPRRPAQRACTTTTGLRGLPAVMMADRACRFEQPGPSALADDASPPANHCRPRPQRLCLCPLLTCSSRSLVLPSLPHPRISHTYVGLVVLQGKPPRFRPAPLALGSPSDSPLHSPLSTLSHPVLFPGVHGPPASHCPRYPLAFDLASVPYLYYS